MTFFDKVLAGGAARGTAVAVGADRLLQTLSGFAAAFTAKPVAQPVVADDARSELTRINDADLAHLAAFPACDRSHVMEKIMSRMPLANQVHTENHHFEKTMLLLHDEGYGLIDMQPLETALTTVWYRQGRSLPWHKRAEVTMVLWETTCAGDSTSVMTWRI